MGDFFKNFVAFSENLNSMICDLILLLKPNIYFDQTLFFSCLTELERIRSYFNWFCYHALSTIVINKHIPKNMRPSLTKSLKHFNDKLIQKTFQCGYYFELIQELYPLCSCSRLNSLNSFCHVALHCWVPPLDGANATTALFG